MSAGRAWIFGDNVDTDALAPGLWMKFDIEEIAKHCLEGLDPAFARDVRPGDVLVAGENFGMGSSREQAPAALRQLGVAAVVAKSFAGLFFRNCVNLGLAPLECAGAGRIRAGDALAVDPIAGRIENRSTGETLSCEPIPPHLAAMIADGGLLPHLARKLATRRSVLAGALALATLGASAASVAQIARTTLDGEWRVIDAEGRLPAPETRWSPPTLRFDTASGRLSGTSGVNSLTATLIVEDETLRLGPPAMTKRAGPQPAMEFESAMLGALQRAAAWRIAGPTLTLSDAGGMPLMRLEATP